MEYMINIWHSGENNGTGVYWRGTDKRTFEKKTVEAYSKYKPFRKVARITVTEKRTVLSFAANFKAYIPFIEARNVLKCKERRLFKV